MMFKITFKINTPFDDLSFKILLLSHNKKTNKRISKAQNKDALISNAANVKKFIIPPSILHYS